MVDKREERGPKNPGVSLASAIEMLRRVRDGVGMGRASREMVAQALGYSAISGTANRALAALVHFGLMERSGASALQVSDLGKHILAPRTENEAREAIAEAVMRPALYQKLFNRFGGQALPALLGNILVRDFGILQGSSEEVVKVFRESVEFAGLLRNGVLHQSLENEESAETAEAGGAKEEGQSDSGDAVRDEGSKTPHASSPPANGTQRYTIPLDMMGRVATIDIPLPVSTSDLRRVRSWAEYMATISQDEAE